MAKNIDLLDVTARFLSFLYVQARFEDMKKIVAFSLVFVAIVGFVTLLSDEGQATSVESKMPPYEMVADLDVVMGYLGDLFDEIPEKVKANRIRKIRTEAMFLAELTNASSYSKDWREENGWIGYMKSMKADFIAMSAAAKKKDKAKVNALHKKITGTCDACHEKIRDA